MADTPDARPEELLAHARWVRALATRLARDQAAADDLEQETWMRALASPPLRGPLRPWLGRVLGNVARRARRSEGRRREHEERAAAPAEPRSQEELLEAFERQGELARLVGELDEPYRTVVLRRYYEGESSAQIARAAGLPAATVRSQLARALAQLRRRMVVLHGDERSAFAALAAIAGVRSLDVPLDPLAQVAQGVWLMKQTSKVAWAAGAVLALFVSYAGIRALSAMLEETPREAPPALAAPAAELLARESGDLARPEREDTPRRGQPEPALAAAPEEAPPQPTRLLARASDDHGAVAGALIWRRGKQAEDQRQEVSAPAGTDGRVTLTVPDDALRISSSYQLPLVFALEAPGRATRFFHATPEKGRDTDLGDMLLEPGGSLSGRVIDEQGRPVANAEVLATGVVLDGAIATARLNGPVRGLGLPSTRSGATGGFVLTGARVGDARLWARSGDGPWTVTDPLEVAHAVQTAVGDVVLVAARSSERIAGVVLGPSGAPVPHAVVRYTCHAADFQPAEVEADGEGRFEIAARAPEEHVLRADDPSGELRGTYVEGVEPGDLEVRIELPQQRWMEVRVVDARSDEVPEKPWVIAEDHFAHFFWGAPRPKQQLGDGVFRLGVPQASFHVRGSAKAHDSAREGPFEPSSAPAEIVLRLAPQALVRGRVLVGGEPQAGAQVQLRELAGADFHMIGQGFPMRMTPSGRFETETDGQGRFALPARSNWEHFAVLARKEGYALAESTPLAVPPDGLDGVEIELGRGGTLEGNVRVPRGRDPRGHIVAISRGDGFVQSTRTDGEGFYRFEQLTPGGWQVERREADVEYVVSIQQEPADIEWNCTVFEGSTTRHDLELAGAAVLEGRLAFDGEPAVGWTATLRHPVRHLERFEEAPRDALLDAEGHFRLEARAAAYTLRIQSPPGDVPLVLLEQDLELAPDTPEHSADLATGGLAGRSARGAAGIRLERKTEGRLMRVTFEPDADGEFQVEGIPAGRYQVFRAIDVGAGSLWWKPGESLAIPTGEAQRVDLE